MTFSTYFSPGVALQGGGGSSGGGGSTFPVTGGGDTFLTRKSTANIRLGAADTTGTTAPTPQFLSAQSWASSTTNNQTGANFTIDGSQGTGTGAGGSIVFRVAPAGGTANGVQNPLVAQFQVNGSGGVTGQDGATANTLALRNGTAAQTFRVYNTYTDASNGAWVEHTSDANFHYIKATNNGTGSAKPLILQGASGTSLILQVGSGGPYWSVTGSAIVPAVNNSYDLGSAASAVRNIYAGTSITPGRGVAVASLPTPTTGMIARVTDATAPTIGTTVVGGGAAYALVNYNGANWTVIGV
jgi:hypothetical protein